MDKITRMLPAYLEYWGLREAPFSLAPNPGMFYLSDQHRECLMRLKFAIHSGKGGALLISENAGNGKTTTLNLLMREFAEDLGDRMRVAYLDYPTMTPVQMVGEIARQLGVGKLSGDKVADMNALRDLLRSNHIRGIQHLVVVDEGQMMADNVALLQEFRILLNCCTSGEFLLSFILSGQAPLEPAVRAIPEFWQRLPVRFFLKDLHQADSAGMIRHRLAVAGVTRPIFTDTAMEGVYRYSKGCPRVICAVADLALVVGHSTQSRQVDFAEVSQACSDMEHSGTSYHYFNFLEGGDTRPTGLSATPPKIPAMPPPEAVPMATHVPTAAVPVVSVVPASELVASPVPAVALTAAVNHGVSPSLSAPAPAAPSVAVPLADKVESCPSCGTECVPGTEFCPKCAAMLRVNCGKCGTLQSARLKACAYCSFPLSAWAKEAERELMVGLKRLNQYRTPEENEAIKFRHHRTMDGRVLYFSAAAGMLQQGAKVREIKGGKGGRFKSCSVMIGNRRLVLLNGKKITDFSLSQVTGCDILPEGNKALGGMLIRCRDTGYEIRFPVREGRRAAFYRLLQSYLNRMRGTDG